MSLSFPIPDANASPREARSRNANKCRTRCTVVDRFFDRCTGLYVVRDVMLLAGFIEAHGYRHFGVRVIGDLHDDEVLDRRDIEDSVVPTTREEASKNQEDYRRLDRDSTQARAPASGRRFSGPLVRDEQAAVRALEAPLRVVRGP
jgi:hypothetical protein